MLAWTFQVQEILLRIPSVHCNFKDVILLTQITDEFLNEIVMNNITDAAENIKVTKAKSKEKIDGIVASIMALDRCLRSEGEPQAHRSKCVIKVSRNTKLVISGFGSSWSKK